MRLRITKNVMVAYESFSLHFTVVPSATSFFINLVLNYLEKNDTHFIDTHSNFSQRHLIGVTYLGVMLVAKIAMASPTIVLYASLISMLNVV